jgi:D-aminopeptidase
MTRAADLGIRIGLLPSGPAGSITDVPGAGLGHATVWRDEPDPPAGRGIARTGVTVLDPGGNLFRSPVPAGGAVLNGAGECTGFLAAAEWGLAETPVFLTSTMQVGRVYDAACELLMAQEPRIGIDEVIIPIVAECDDSFLSDARRMQVSAADVAAALAAARAAAAPRSAAIPYPGRPAGRGSQPPAEGAVGAGTGMSCLGYKGGIGTASRVLPSGHTVGVLLLANFGGRERLTIDGVPAGRLLLPPGPAGRPAPEAERAAPPAGSCITIVLTDGPLEPASCARLARRAGLGLARTGSIASHGSGEIFLALATGLRSPRGEPPGPGPAITGSDLDPFFTGVVDATEEAVLNCLLAAPTVTGRAGNTSYGLPAGQVRDLLAAAGRIPPHGPGGTTATGEPAAPAQPPR